MQGRDVLKVPLVSDQDFPKFLKRVRLEENVLLEQLSEGLMTVSQLARIEKGQRPIPKNLRDRLLGRLGIASDLYENLLNIEDYAAWKQQRNILCAVEQQNTRRAHELITAYEGQQPVQDNIKLQFCMMMRAEVLKQREIDLCEIAACYKEAAKQTIPDIEHLHLENRLFSIQEINVILEYAFYHRGEDFPQKCGELMAFVENSMYDDLSKVKVYPKIVYYYLREILSGQDFLDAEELRECLQVCDKAVGMLRDTGRAYFLLELLEIRLKLTGRIKQALPKNEGLWLSCQQSRALVDLLKKLAAEYDVPAYMRSCTYLYHQRWVFYIGDVLRIRREMYGLTQKELSEGICSSRTLRRAEKGEANMQREALKALLDRLGLSREFQRSRIVTDDREVLKLREDILIARNNRDFNRCRELLNQIRGKISYEIPQNRQYLIELEATLDWIENKISCSEYANKEGEALRCTLNVNRLIHTEEIFLTEMEVSCICNEIRGLENIEEKREHIRFLIHFFDSYEQNNVLSDCIAMYEYVMMFIASELGNVGEYQTAIRLDKKILREAYYCRRVWVTGIILYDILWTETQQKTEQGKTMDKEKMTDCLNQCRLISHFCKQTFYEKFYDDLRVKSLYH